MAASKFETINSVKSSFLEIQSTESALQKNVSSWNVDFLSNIVLSARGTVLRTDKWMLWITELKGIKRLLTLNLAKLVHDSLSCRRKKNCGEANQFSASQKIPRIVWNPNVNYRIHKSPPPLPTISQISPSPKPCEILRYLTSLHGEMMSAPRPKQTWNTTPCRFSATAYSIHSQLHF